MPLHRHCSWWGCWSAPSCSASCPTSMVASSPSSSPSCCRQTECNFHTSIFRFGKVFLDSVASGSGSGNLFGSDRIHQLVDSGRVRQIVPFKNSNLYCRIPLFLSRSLSIRLVQAIFGILSGVVPEYWSFVLGRLG